MRKIMWMVCVASLLLSHMSCQRKGVDSVMINVASDTRMSEQGVHNLVQQARNGDLEAYKSLAYCYRDGNGIKQSCLNAMFMYSVYAVKIGQNVETVVDLFPEDHPYRLLFELLYSSDIDEEMEAKLDLFRQIAPAEAKWIEAIRTYEKERDRMEVMHC